MKWFRLYGDLINEPKVLKLPDNLRWIWIGILCIASKNEGNLPGVDDIGLLLRMKPGKVDEALSKLTTAGLIDELPGGRRPRNWDRWQYKSDDSTARVKRFRQRQRNVSSDVTETPPDTDSDTDSDTESEGESGRTASAVPRVLIGRKAKTGWPPDHSLSQASINFARNQGFNPDHTKKMFEAFSRYHRSEGTQSADWDLTWERWVHQEIRFKREEPDRDRIDGRL
jgi:hypothetical protein